MKADTVHYCKSLVASVEKDHVFIEQYFHTSQGDEDLNYHTLQPRDFVYRKRHLQKVFSRSLERPLPLGTVSQSLCHQTSGNRLVDSHITSKEGTKP